MTARTFALLPLLLLALLATGCERLGIKDPARVAAEREAEGKAVGAGCRHAGRSLEDCYVLNEKAHKAAVFAGWKEMNDYMAANDIAVVPPQLAHLAVGEAAGEEAGGKPEANSRSHGPAGTAAAGGPASR